MKVNLCLNFGESLRTHDGLEFLNAVNRCDRHDCGFGWVRQSTYLFIYIYISRGLVSRSHVVTFCQDGIIIVNIPNSAIQVYRFTLSPIPTAIPHRHLQDMTCHFVGIY